MDRKGCISSTMDHLMSQISDQEHCIREVECRARQVDDEYRRVEQKLLDSQRENRILARQIHNLRKEGHIKVAKLKTEFQRKQKCEDKLRSKLGSELDVLKRKKSYIFKILKQIENENDCFIKQKALENQKKADIDRMDSLVTQQRLYLQKLQEESQYLQRALKQEDHFLAVPAMEEQVNLRDQNQCQLVPIAESLILTSASSRNQQNSPKLIRVEPNISSSQGYNEGKYPTIQNSTGISQGNQSKNSDYPSENSSTIREIPLLSQDDTNIINKTGGNRENKNKKVLGTSEERIFSEESATQSNALQVNGVQSSSIKQEESLITGDSQQTGDGIKSFDNNSNSSKQANSSNKPINSRSNKPTNSSSTTRPTGSSNNISTDSSSYKPTNSSSNEPTSSSSMIKPTNNINNKAPCSSSNITPNSSSSTRVTYSLAQLSQSITQSNKLLVRQYGQDIKDKVNALNSLLEKIAKDKVTRQNNLEMKRE